MADTLQYQIRLYLDDAAAALARWDPAAAALRPLAEVLARHDAVMVSQYDAFAAYAAGQEAAGRTNEPLYRWTRAVLDDPAKAAKHIGAFAVRVHGAEMYGREEADAVEAELQPLVGGLVLRLSRHDTNPASNMPVPEQYR